MPTHPVIKLSLTPEVMAALTELSRLEGMSLTAYARWVLRKHAIANKPAPVPITLVQPANPPEASI